MDQTEKKKITSSTEVEEDVMEHIQKKLQLPAGLTGLTGVVREKNTSATDILHMSLLTHTQRLKAIAVCENKMFLHTC